MSFRKGHCEKRCPTLLLISPKKPETSSSGPRNRDPARSTTRHTTMQATKAWVICAASLYFTSLDTKSLIYIQMQSFDLYACAHGVLARDSGGTVFARKYKSIWPCLSQDFASDYWMHQQATQKRASLALLGVCAFCKYPPCSPHKLYVHTPIPLVLIIAERKAPNNAQPHVQKRRQSGVLLVFFASAYMVNIYPFTMQRMMKTG